MQTLGILLHAQNMEASKVSGIFPVAGVAVRMYVLMLLSTTSCGPERFFVIHW